MKTLICNTIPEAHYRTVYHAYNMGREITDQRGDVTRELYNLCVVIPTDDISHCEGFERLDDDFAEGLINKDVALKKGKDFVYSYGDRIWFLNQLDKIIKLLIENTETRRAYIPIFDKIDNCGAVDIPCCTSIQFLIRDNKLHLIVYFRSNDVFYALPSDIFGFRTLQKYVSEKVDTPIGSYTHFIASAHVRMTDEDAIKKLLRKA